MSKFLWISTVLIAVALVWVWFGPAAPGTGEAGATPTPKGLPKVVRPPSGGELVLIPAGTFTMGDADGRADETPHKVELDAFYIDRAPVTQAMYERVRAALAKAGLPHKLPANPSHFSGPDNPVERMQWIGAARFCNACSRLEGRTPCYDEQTWACDFEANGYRLPTEAEWEYACRAGSDAAYCFGDDVEELNRYAWYKRTSRGRTWPVRQKAPNAWGLYDVHGNVWQWCNDWYAADYYTRSPRRNPRGPETGQRRVLRGGAYREPARRCRAAYRRSEVVSFGDVCTGTDPYGLRRVRRAPAAAKATGRRTNPD